MPVGMSRTATSNGQIRAVARTSSQQRASGQTGLHQVPVPEEHGVGDRPEERRPHQRAGDRQPGWRAGVDAGGDETHEADRRSDEIEHRRELGHARVGSVGGPVDAGHRRHPRRSLFQPFSLAPHAGPAPDDGHAEGDGGGDHDPHRGAVAHRHRPDGPTDDDRARGEQEVDAAQQPAVPDADLPPAGGDPQEEQATHRPLQQHRRGIEADHDGRRLRAALAPARTGPGGHTVAGDAACRRRGDIRRRAFTATMSRRQ